jgi:hypothetical protein
MGTDYATRIVARALGRSLAAAPLMTPRGRVGPAEQEVPDPFEAAVDLAASAETGAPLAEHGVRPARAEGAGSPTDAAATSATPATPHPLAGERAYPVASRITHEVTTHSIVERERIVEQVIARAVPPDVPAAAGEGAREAADPAARRAAPIARDPPPRHDDEPASGRSRPVDFAEPTHAPRRQEAAQAPPMRDPAARSPALPAPRPLPADRAAHVPLRPRPAPLPAPAPPAAERSRLVIGRLVVEIASAAPAAASRPALRPAAPSPRPFRAGGPSSVAVGRPSGLGQG